MTLLEHETSKCMHRHMSDCHVQSNIFTTYLYYSFSLLLKIKLLYRSLILRVFWEKHFFNNLCLEADIFVGFMLHLEKYQFPFYPWPPEGSVLLLGEGSIDVVRPQLHSALFRAAVASVSFPLSLISLKELWLTSASLVCAPLILFFIKIIPEVCIWICTVWSSQ